MKKNYPLTATILFTAITAFTSCITTSELQCDELYERDYNCDLPQYNSYNPYRTYYPNTQIIYYVPRYCLPNNDRRAEDHREHNVIKGKRPDIWNKPKQD